MIFNLLQAVDTTAFATPVQQEMKLSLIDLASKRSEEHTSELQSR